MSHGTEQQIEGIGRRANLCASLAIAAALSITATVSTVQAQGVEDQARIAQLSAEQTFDIPSQSLTTALTQFGQQSGMQITVHGTLPRDLTAPAVQGTMTSEQALRQLLTGSGLIYTLSGSTVAIERPGQSADSAIVLDPVTVEGQRLFDPGRTEGTGSYAGSQVTVGSKIPTSIREIPQSVSVITRDRIEDENFTTLQEAIERTTGMRVRNFDGVRASFTSRGYDATVTHDGLRVDDTTTFSAAPDMAIYDRVEVLRGPAGLFQGTGEPGGSINLVRKRPLDEFQLSGAARVGSWNYYRTDADVTGPLVESGRVRGRLVAAYEDRESFIDLYESKKPLIYGTLDADVTEDTVLSVGGMYQEHDHSVFAGNPIVFSDGTRVDLPREHNIGVPWSYAEEYTAEAFAELEHKFDSGVTAKLSGRFVERWLDRIHVQARTPITVGTNDVTIRAGRDEDLRNDYIVDGHVSAPVRLIGDAESTFLLGADYNFSTRDRNRGDTATYVVDAFEPDHNIPKPNLTFNSFRLDQTEEYGAYGQTRLKPGIDWLTVILGGRLSSWTATMEDRSTGQITSDVSVDAQFTPYAGLVVDMTDELSVYGSYASIFEPQTSMTPSREFVSPREGNQYEVGVKGEFFAGRLLGHLAGFWIEDINRAVGIEGCIGDYCSEAAGLVRSQGIEAEISGELLPGWQVLAGYAYVNTKYVDDPNNQGEVFATWMPKHSVNLTTQYDVQGGQFKGVNFGAGMRAVSSYFTDFSGMRATQDAYAVFDLGAGYKISDSLSTRLSINNVFDEEYYERLGGAARNNRWGEPRNFMLTVRAEW
jgi:outer-membrane receptor for ferric coprogen and ferric-rhodotorulic acid